MRLPDVSSLSVFPQQVGHNALSETSGTVWDRPNDDLMQSALPVLGLGNRHFVKASRRVKGEREWNR